MGTESSAAAHQRPSLPWRPDMKKFATAAVLATLMAVPAYAQSSAPEFGSGNIPSYGSGPSYGYGSVNRWAYDRDGWGAYAGVHPRPYTRARMYQGGDGMYWQNATQGRRRHADAGRTPATSRNPPGHPRRV